MHLLPNSRRRWQLPNTKYFFHDASASLVQFDLIFYPDMNIPLTPVRFLRYAQRVPRLLPSFRPGFEDDGQSPRWREALWDQAFQWGFVATLMAFAFTLSDPIGYAFAYATIAFLALQRLARTLWIRLRHT